MIIKNCEIGCGYCSCCIHSDHLDYLKNVLHSFVGKKKESSFAKAPFDLYVMSYEIN